MIYHNMTRRSGDSTGYDIMMKAEPGRQMIKERQESFSLSLLYSTRISLSLSNAAYST